MMGKYRFRLGSLYLVKQTVKEENSWFKLALHHIKIDCAASCTWSRCWLNKHRNDEDDSKSKAYSLFP